MLASTSITRREIQIARILRPLGQAPMTRAQAERAGQLLHVHWTTVYRLRRRFLRDPVTTSLVPNASGRLKEPHRLLGAVEEVVAAALERRLPRQSELAHPVLDLCLGCLGRRCRAQSTAATTT